ncbi:hypothetical protein GCM10017771_08830 [Streptomyces capitiformicae]|uniref:Uncharacterized protein n=1 Tax=Streptomyces capitiformicae TaxID=2014920 RepID=A0A919L4C4_9ACTN|nr:hypothetical protein GCM10017771_08830 [Streptomyces capitiformicae]
MPRNSGSWVGAGPFSRLEHWVESIATSYVSENMCDGHEVGVRVHLVAGLGAHRLERLERFYWKMARPGAALVRSGAAGWRGEGVPLARAVGTGRDPFPLLLLPVLAEELDQRIRQADRPPSGAGLGRLVLAADLLMLRAVADLPPARVVSAAVRVLGPEPVIAGTDVPRVQVDDLPVQPEGLPFPEPERQGDDPARAVAELGRLDEQAMHLLDRVRLDVLLFEPRSLGDLVRGAGLWRSRRRWWARARAALPRQGPPGWSDEHDE